MYTLQQEKPDMNENTSYTVQLIESSQGKTYSVRIKIAAVMTFGEKKG